MQESIYPSNGKYPVNGNVHVDSQQKNDSVFDIQQLIAKVLHNWYWFVLLVIMSLVAAWLYLRYTTPTYRINAKILIQDDSKGGGMPGPEIFEQLELFNNKSSVDNEMEILQSRTLLEQVVTNLHLNVVYYAEGRIKETEQYGNLPFHAEWLSMKDTLSHTITYEIRPVGDGKYSITNDDINLTANWNDTIRVPEGVLMLKRDKIFPFEYDAYQMKVSSIEKTVAKYRLNLDMGIPNKQVSVIDLMLASDVPGKGERVLNELITTYLQNGKEDKNRVADSTISFIDNRLMIVSRELSDVEMAIQQFKQANDVADLSEQAKLLVNNSSESAKLLSDAQVRLNIVESLEQYIKDEKNNKRIVPSSLVVTDATFIALIEKYNALQMQRERLTMSSTDANPLVLNIDQQLAGLRGDISSNLASFKKGVEIELRELQRHSGAMTQQVKKVPAKERVFLDYSRQQALKQDLYLFLLKKREESAISKTSNIAKARIIDLAKSETLPFKPKKAFIFVLAFLIGLAIPSLILYLRDLLNRRISSKDDIVSQTPVPVIAEIGHSADLDLSTKEGSQSVVAEQFRAMRTNLQFVLSGEKDKVILLTSSMSGEGKTFVATNLATVLGLSEKKVLLMELDLRKPKISEKLGISNSVGFSTYAIGRSQLEDIIKPSGINENCWIIPSGPIPPNPAELLMLDQTVKLFAELRSMFDYIIIDTAPIGLVTDAQLLAKNADATLYLVRQAYTFKQQLLLTKELFLQRKMPRLNLVINDVKNGHTYGYGYGYSYAYGYGSEDNRPKGLLSRFRKTVRK